MLFIVMSALGSILLLGNLWKSWKLQGLGNLFLIHCFLYKFFINEHPGAYFSLESALQLYIYIYFTRIISAENGGVF